MPSTAVVADTTSYLPAELIQRHDIHLVSLYVGIEGEQDREADIDDLAWRSTSASGHRTRR